MEIFVHGWLRGEDATHAALNFPAPEGSEGGSWNAECQIGLRERSIVVSLFPSIPDL